MSGLNNYYSDYGSGTSGSSSNSSTSWPSMDTWSAPSATSVRQTKSYDQTPASFNDLVNGRCTLEDIMKEFQMNGSDSPYTPDEDRIWGNPAASLSGMGPASSYLRQKSWPAPERSPAPPLRAAPAPPATLAPDVDWLAAVEFKPREFLSTSTPIEELSPPRAESSLTSAQARVLCALPDATLFALLQQLQLARDGHRRSRRLASECRFCKNNGERESYYRSHALKDAGGRVACPVLRAFTCVRCGASGDDAHTIKYCPLSTADERMKSAAMMRSVRLASGRRRAAPGAAGLAFGDAAPPLVSDNNSYNSYSTSPLDPLWAALEQKLML